MDNYKIHIIDTDYHGTLEIATFLVETDNGPILVETSAHSSLPKVIAGIEKIGYDWKEIKHVLLTHIHLDHAGAAWCFAENGATVFLHPLGYNHMNQPERLLKSATMIYGDLMDYLWGTLKPIPAEQLVKVEDFEVIKINGLNFKAIHSPGHAKHHIAWQLDNHLFAGDLAGIRMKGGNSVVPPCPPPDINVELWIESIDKALAIKEIDTYYITHFGEVRDIHEHMEKLKRVLQQYADFTYPYFKNETPVEQIIEEFRRFSMNLLREDGMPENLIEAYEAGNSSIGNVHGLMRYWKKKTEVS